MVHLEISWLPTAPVKYSATAAINVMMKVAIGFVGSIKIIRRDSLNCVEHQPRISKATMMRFAAGGSPLAARRVSPTYVNNNNNEHVSMSQHNILYPAVTPTPGGETLLGIHPNISLR